MVIKKSKNGKKIDDLKFSTLKKILVTQERDTAFSFSVRSTETGDIYIYLKASSKG